MRGFAKRTHRAGEILAKRLVEHLDRAGFVVMKPAGGAALARGHGNRAARRSSAPVRSRSGTPFPYNFSTDVPARPKSGLSHWNDWRSQGDSNPCFRRERAGASLRMLWPQRWWQSSVRFRRLLTANGFEATIYVPVGPLWVRRRTSDKVKVSAPAKA
jgi:hypothetical protein